MPSPFALMKKRLKEQKPLDGLFGASFRKARNEVCLRIAKGEEYCRNHPNEKTSQELLESLYRRASEEFGLEREEAHLHGKARDMESIFGDIIEEIAT